MQLQACLQALVSTLDCLAGTLFEIAIEAADLCRLCIKYLLWH